MMQGNPAKRTHHLHTGIRWPFYSECFSPAARSAQLWKNNNWQERSGAL
jgi:hypothetical protein